MIMPMRIISLLAVINLGGCGYVNYELISDSPGYVYDRNYQFLTDTEDDAWFTAIEYFDAEKIRHYLDAYPNGKYFSAATGFVRLHEMLTQQGLKPAVDYSILEADELTWEASDLMKNKNYSMACEKNMQALRNGSLFAANGNKYIRFLYRYKPSVEGGSNKSGSKKTIEDLCGNEIPSEDFNAELMEVSKEIRASTVKPRFSAGRGVISPFHNEYINTALIIYNQRCSSINNFNTFIWSEGDDIYESSGILNKKLKPNYKVLKSVGKGRIHRVGDDGIRSDERVVNVYEIEEYSTGDKFDMFIDNVKITYIFAPDIPPWEYKVCNDIEI